MRIFPLLRKRVVVVPISTSWAAMTVYPFIFVFKDWKDKSEISQTKVLYHENIHIRQQDGWWKWLGPFGLAAWLFCYLLLLPVGWNPFRWKWEMDAYTQVGEEQDWIADTLQKRYKLWWMNI